MFMGWLGWIVLILTVYLFMVHFTYKVFDGSDHDWFLTFFLWLPGSLILAVFAFGIFLLVSSSDPFGHYKRVESDSTYTEIFSIGLHDNIGGHFALGCGTVETKPVYYYYKRNNKGYVLDRINADNCTIVETDSIKPSIKHVKYKKEGDAGWYKRAVFGKNEAFWRPCSDKEETAEYIIYIPVGSIMQNYDIKL